MTPDVAPKMAVASPVVADFYYVIRTKVGAEQTAAEHLTNQSVAVYAPRVRLFRKTTYTAKHVPRPLFPRYIFAAFTLQDYFSRVMNTRGVERIVRFGEEFARVDGAILDAIAVHENAQGYVQLDDMESDHEFSLAVGAVVRITMGAFIGQQGTIERLIVQTGDLVLSTSLGRLTLPEGAVEAM